MIITHKLQWDKCLSHKIFPLIEKGWQDEDRNIHFFWGLAGKNIKDAVLEACNRRFRAIIMTSLSTMIAMMPLIIGNIGPGAGEGSRMAVGATIFGGMLISTIFTLFVTPTMYVLLTKNTKRIDVIDIELQKELKK